MNRTVQRTLALEQANAARRAARDLRATIRAGGRRDGPVRAAKAVQAADSSIRFCRLLEAVPGIGEDVSRGMLRKARINGMARLNDWQITDRQRTRLIAQLMARANRPADA